MPPRPSSAVGFPALGVQYYRRMKQARVYPVTISWRERPKPIGSIKNVTLRLLAAGAQIVPSEQTLDASRPELKATFFVTPLARGWLRAQRVEVVVAGRKVQEIPFASRVTCQCWASFWFIMAVAAPILLIWLRRIDVIGVVEGMRHQFPAMPEFITDNVPGVGEAWTWLTGWVADAAANFMKFNAEHLLAFPTGLVCLLLSIFSLFMHRDAKARRYSEPIAVPVDGGVS